MDKSYLRQHLRQQRQQLTDSQRLLASLAAMNHICSMPAFINSQHIAAYLSHNNELNPQPIIQQIWAMGKNCYIPCIKTSQEKTLMFTSYRPDTSCAANRFGILEPVDKSSTIAAEELDLVLLPLVSFTEIGIRLGTGGGYYDHTFAFLQNITRPAKPLLVGLGYAFQQSEHIVQEAWDISLDAVITEEELITFNESNQKAIL